VEIVGITDIVGIVSSNPQTRRRKVIMSRCRHREVVLDPLYRRHNLEECKTFQDRKKMPPPPPVAQEPHQGEHRRADPDNEDQMDEINMIFRGSMSIASNTHGKKLERDISLAQRIEPGRRMK
jgi:hypothetical protein